MHEQDKMNNSHFQKLQPPKIMGFLPKIVSLTYFARAQKFDTVFERASDPSARFVQSLHACSVVLCVLGCYYFTDTNGRTLRDFGWISGSCFVMER